MPQNRLLGYDNPNPFEEVIVYDLRFTATIRGGLVFALAFFAVRLLEAADPQLNPQIQLKLGAVYTHRSDVSVLSQTETMASLKSEDLSALIDQADGYLPAMAIFEARRRMDLTLHIKIRDRYQKTVLEPSEVRFDPHFISQGAVAFVASTEYLASVEGSDFLPELLARPEVWQVPSWFRATFAAVGPGWVKAVIQHANSLGPRKSPAVLMSLVAGGASEANLPELRLALRTEKSDSWMAAMEACARVSNGGCWDLITQESLKQTPLEQLRMALVQFQSHRIDQNESFLAAERAANALNQSRVPTIRGQLAIELGGFIRLMRAAGNPPPPTLVELIRTSGISPLLRDALGN